jgi:TOMM system kinase/cyclase fusion protein
MGTVWRAWDERLRRYVAIKQVRGESFSHAHERLLREARAVARLNHPAIVQVYDLVERKDGDWVVMELIAGRNLRQLLEEQGPLSPLRAVQLGREIAEGLAEAHVNNILHRDLKTTNVMVTPAGRAKILDFGLAKEYLEGDTAAHELSLSAPGVVLGTAYAMSPEQAMGQTLDPRSDLFSLGSLLYEALTGTPPFRGESQRESLTRVLNLRPRALHEVRPEIPRKLSALIGWMLEKDRRYRPQSAGEVAGVLASTAAKLSPATADARERRWQPDEADAEASSDLTVVERPPQPSSSGTSKIGERRRLTVACCGLVHLDDLSGESRFLDVEPLSEAMAELQDLAADLAEPLGGCVGAVLGHALWLYFGYPRAHEDDAQRAVRFARRLSAEIEQRGARSHSRKKLAVRITVHTGPAVVTARSGQASQIQLGSTLDVAMGLQNAALPNTIVVSAESNRLITRSFQTEALAPIHLPGCEEPVRVHRILGTLDQRDDESGAARPLVGRDREIELLLDRFRLSRAGSGQAVLILGEAGIGKSRLVRALRDGLADEATTWLVGYGSPYNRSSPLAPIVDLLERTLFSPGDETPDQKLRRLEDLLRRYSVPLPENAPVLAALLGLPDGGQYPPLTITPDVRREKTLEILVALLADMAEDRPLVLVIEDLHWIDPSTLELLDLLLAELATLPLLLVTTSRPELQLHWKQWAHITQIGLSRLTDGETETLIDRLAEARGLSDAMRRQIVAKTDGVPLFIEELTKAVIESGWSGDIPSTLDGSLMARLDRLDEAKEVAQLASVIGRTFSFDLLAAIFPLEETALRRGIEELIEAELVYRRGVASRARYIFKHALIQDAAYLSLLSSQRREVHERVALALEEKLAQGQETEAEILAYHFEKADLAPRAIPYLQQAALRATQRSAFSEALSHGRKAIDLLATLPPSPQTREQELAIRSTMGVALVPTCGYASQEVEENAARSQELCRELGDTPRLIPALYGLWVYHLLRGNRQQSNDLAQEIGRLAQDREEDVFIGFSSRGITAFFAGEFARSRSFLESAMAIYRPEIHPTLAQTFGDESGLLPHLYHFWCVWILGQADEALRRKDEVQAIVQALPSPYVRVTFFLFEMILWHWMRRPEEVLRVSEEFVALSREQRFPFFLALATCGYGWTAMYRGEPEAGIAQIQEGLANHKAIGTMLPRAYWLTYLIEVYLHAGAVDDGLAAVEEGLALTQTQLDVYYDAELYRLRGELLLLRPDPAGAEAAFHTALAIARRQGALALELRAATSLGRMLHAQGRAGEAHPVLAGVYGTFREGFTTADLIEARRVLDLLAAAV